MVTYRKARPEEREAYIAFANMVFGGPDADESFEKLIPKVYGSHIENAHIHNIAVDDEKGIRGLVAVLPNELYVGGETLRTGYVGTVSVHPDARGEGHMKKLMNMSQEEMLADGVDIAFLGGRRQRYEYFDYAKGGIRHHVEISKACVRHALKNVDASEVSFEEITKDSPWAAPAHALHEKKWIRFCRKPEAFVDICCSYFNHPWAILCHGEFVGYLVASMHKNEFAEIILKDQKMIDAVIKAWVEQNDTDVALSFAEWEKDALRHLNTYAEGVKITTNVQSCVLNPRRVLKVMLTAKAQYEKLADASMTFEIEKERFTVTVRDGKAEIEDGGEEPVCLNRLQASQLFAYPYDYEGRPEVPAGWFPLPIYKASPDSF